MTPPTTAAAATAMMIFLFLWLVPEDCFAVLVFDWPCGGNAYDGRTWGSGVFASWIFTVCEVRVRFASCANAGVTASNVAMSVKLSGFMTIDLSPNVVWAVVRSHNVTPVGFDGRHRESSHTPRENRLRTAKLSAHS